MEYLADLIYKGTATNAVRGRQEKCVVSDVALTDKKKLAYELRDCGIFDDVKEKVYTISLQYDEITIVPASSPLYLIRLTPLIPEEFAQLRYRGVDAREVLADYYEEQGEHQLSAALRVERKKGHGLYKPKIPRKRRR